MVWSWSGPTRLLALRRATASSSKFGAAAKNLEETSTLHDEIARSNSNV
jgi:hypothetical protein